MQYPLDSMMQYCYRNSMGREVRGDPRGFIARVEAARENCGLGVYEFSEKIDQSSSYWSSWMSRHRDRESFPRGDIVAAMANVLEVPMSFLLGVDEAPTKGTPPTFLRQPLPRLLKALGAIPAEDEEIELDQVVSAGEGKPASDRRKKPRLYLVEVSGDCMVPEIDNGDRVKFDPALSPEDGDWVVATIDGERAIVKGLEVQGAVQRLLPLNGEPLVIDENVRIVGVVLYHEKPGPRGRRRR